MSAILDSIARQDAQRSADLDATDQQMNAHLPDVFRLALAPFAPPVHSFRREGGTGLSDEVVPTCTCGWRGKGVPGWKDFQCAELDAQEAQHRMDQCTPQDMREAGAI